MKEREGASCTGLKISDLLLFRIIMSIIRIAITRVLGSRSLLKQLLITADQARNDKSFKLSLPGFDESLLKWTRQRNRGKQ